MRLPLREALKPSDRWRYTLVQIVTWPLEGFFTGLFLFLLLLAVFRSSGFGWWATIGLTIPSWIAIHLVVRTFCNLLWIWGLWSRDPADDELKECDDSLK